MTAPEPAPRVEVELTVEASARPIRNLFPLYLHDVASYEHKPPNRHGVLHDDDDVGSWDDVLAGQAAWWQKPGTLFPYLVRAGGAPAGFALIASGPYVPTADVDFCVYEFFVAHAWRGRDVAAQAVRACVARHPGRWEVMTWPTAARAIAFWRKALPACAADGVRESEEDTSWGRRVVFRFGSRTT